MHNRYNTAIKQSHLNTLPFFKTTNRTTPNSNAHSRHSMLRAAVLGAALLSPAQSWGWGKRWRWPWCNQEPECLVAAFPDRRRMGFLGEAEVLSGDAQSCEKFCEFSTERCAVRGFESCIECGDAENAGNDCCCQRACEAKATVKPTEV